MQDPDRILRVPEVLSIVGLTRRSLYGLLYRDLFPKPLKIGARAIGWRASDIQTWLDTRETAIYRRIKEDKEKEKGATLAPFSSSTPPDVR